ncbi:MAG: hypothetical protein ACLPHI_06650 [Terriglobales bacterium]|jgi:hypothetical protein
MNQDSRSQSPADKSRELHKLSLMSVWIAPVICGIVAIVLSLAVAGFVLGEK